MEVAQSPLLNPRCSSWETQLSSLAMATDVKSPDDLKIADFENDWTDHSKLEIDPKDELDVTLVAFP